MRWLRRLYEQWRLFMARCAVCAKPLLGEPGPYCSDACADRDAW